MPGNTLISQFREQLAENESSDRNFGIVISSCMLIIGLLPILRRGPSATRWWAVAIAAALLLIAVIAPSILRQPKRAWLFLGFVLGLVVNPLVMGIFFFLVVTPAGLLMRLAGRDPLQLRPHPQLTTYWRPRIDPISNMKDQF